jgi:death-on-curing protein
VSDPVFLYVEDVLLIHEEQLGKYGGSAGVRDLGLLESAVAMPRATAERIKDPKLSAPSARGEG